MAIKNRLTVSQKRWLKSAHLLFVATWVGGGACWLALLAASAATTDGGTLKAAYDFLHVIDLNVVVPSAFLVLITGILQGTLTQWGLFKFRWIVAKEVGTVLIMAVGAIPVASWETANITIVSAQGFVAQQNPEFLRNQALLLTANALAVVTMATLVVIAVSKPWGQRAKIGERQALLPR